MMGARAGLLLSAALVLAGPALAQELPTGGTVVAGEALIGAPMGGALRITQAGGRAVIDWQGFSVGAGGHVHFDNGAGATLNRVTGGNPSAIAGQLSATGSLWLMNPAGVLVAPDGRVTTGGSFVAGAARVSAPAFLQGLADIQAAEAAGVVNAGRIEAGGDAVLIGHFVENSGAVLAGGAAALLAAGRVLMRPANGDARIHVELAEGAAGDVRTAGRIEAAAAELRAVGGNVYALAADTGGLVRATGSRQEGGRILLVGGNGVSVAGTLRADGPAGGAIDITAPGILLGAGAHLSAIGDTGPGGTIRVGGARLGGPGLAPARRLLVERGALVDAGSRLGAGGEVILWSEEWTRFEGLIRADGPGGGGFVETSSKGALAIDGGRVEVGRGQWLLDPRDVSIQTGGFNPGPPYPDPFRIDPPATGTGAYVVSRSALQDALNAGSDVIVTTVQPARTDPGTITVAAAINWAGTGNLTLLADANILMNQPVSSSGGSLTLTAGGNISFSSTVSLANAAGLTATAGGNIVVNGALSSAPSATGAVLLQAGGTLQLNQAFTFQGSSSFRGVAGGSGTAISFGGSNNRNFSTALGSLSLEAPGGDIVVGRNSSAAGNFRIGTNGGALSFSAGRDIVLVSSDFGPGRWTRVGNLGVNAPVTLTAGRDITWDVGNFADDFVEVVTGGTLAATAGRAINLTPSPLSPARLQGRGTSFTLTAPAATLDGVVEARGDTLLQGGAFSFGGTAPLFALDANRSFTLAAGAAIAATVPLTIRAPGSGEISFNGPVSGSSLVAEAGDELAFAAPIAMAGTGNALLLAAGRRLVNLAGASPLSAPNGRWLSYSVSPFDDSGWELLNPDAPNLYGRSFGFLPPATPAGTGNRRLYSFTPVLTLTADSGAKTYGEAGPVLGGTLSGLVPGDLPADAVTGSITTSSPGFAANAPAGSYAVVPGGLTLTSQGYQLVTVDGTLLVGPAPLAVAADSFRRLYGAPDPAFTFTVTGLVAGDTAGAVLSGALQRDPGEPVGLYAIRQGSLLANANYALSFMGGTLAIDPAPLTVVASAATREYGLVDPALDFVASGFQLGETAAVLTGGLARAPGEDVGLYAIGQGTLAAPNYVIAFTGADFAITPAPLAITPDAVGRIFGDPDPALTFSAAGFRLGDTAATALVGALARAPGEDVGLYPILPGTLASTGNYRLSFGGADFAITARPLSVRADSFSRLYGDADPLFGFTASGFAPGDDASILSGGLVRAPGEDVGLYAIGQGTLAAANYAIGFVPGTLAITPAPLAVAAEFLSKVYGDPDPLLGFAATGFRLGDTAATVLTGSLARAPGETVGGSPYAVTQGSLEANANYALAFTPGALAITPRPLTLALAGPVSRSYDATVLAPVAPANLQLGGVLPGDSVSASAGSARYDTPDVGTGKLVLADGVRLTGAAASNYSAPATASATVGSITPAPLIARALDATRPFGLGNPPFLLEVTGLFGSDTAAGIGLLADSAADQLSPPGDYAIDVLGTPRNYVVTRLPGTLSITALLPPAFQPAPELVEVPALGGTTQAGVGAGVTALEDTLRPGALPPRLVLATSRYTVAVQPAPPPAGQLGGASAFER